MFLLAGCQEPYSDKLHNQQKARTGWILYDSLHLCAKTAVYETVHTMVWEVGHSMNG